MATLPSIVMARVDQLLSLDSRSSTATNAKIESRARLKTTASAYWDHLVSKKLILRRNSCQMAGDSLLQQNTSNIEDQTRRQNSTIWARAKGERLCTLSRRPSHHLTPWMIGLKKMLCLSNFQWRAPRKTYRGNMRWVWGHLGDPRPSQKLALSSD